MFNHLFFKLSFVGWIFRLFPHLGYCDYSQCCKEYGNAISFQDLDLVLLDKYPQMELLDHIFNQGRNFYFPCQLYHFIFPSTVYRSSSFSISLPILIFFFFKNSQPNKCEVIFHCVLICISLIFIDIESLFIYLLDVCMSSLEKMSIQILYPFLFIFVIQLVSQLVVASQSRSRGIQKFPGQVSNWSYSC